MVLCHSMNTVSVVGYHGVVETLKLYPVQKNLFELFALADRGDEKNIPGTQAR